MQQTHGGAAPYFADSPAGVTMQHVAGRVETPQRGYVTSLGVDRLFAIRDECRSRRHGKSQSAVTTIVGKATFGAGIHIGIDSEPRKTVVVYQGPLQHILLDLNTTLPGKRQKGERAGACKPHVMVCQPATAPAIVIHRLPHGIGNLLQHGQDLFVARAQIVFGQTGATPAYKPLVGMPPVTKVLIGGNRLLGPALNNVQILLLTGRQQEKHFRSAQLDLATPACGRKIVG